MQIQESKFTTAPTAIEVFEEAGFTGLDWTVTHFSPPPGFGLDWFTAFACVLYYVGAIQSSRKDGNQIHENGVPSKSPGFYDNWMRE
jgi:hypothetical protein